MMRIGYDITVLYHAQGGIYRYFVSLLRALIDLAYENDAHLTLVDYTPARGYGQLPCDLSCFDSERVNQQVIDSPTPYKLRCKPTMDFPIGYHLAHQLDAMLDRPQRWWINRQTRRRQHQVLGGLDVLHASDVLQLTARGVGIVATVFDLSPLHLPQFHVGQNTELFMRKMAYICRHTDRVITISQYTANDLINCYPAVAGRVEVIYCSADEIMRPVTETAVIERVQHRYNIPESGYILCVGTLEPRKNLSRLVEAYAQVRADNGSETPPLVLAGKQGWLCQSIFDTVTHLRLQDYVIFTGYIPDADLPALYSGACCFVYPSLFEGFGIPVLEAMACGTPVITSNTSSLPEVAGDAALLVSPECIDDIADALHRLLNDPDLRSRLSSKGKSQAARFSWQVAARQTYSTYQAAKRNKMGY